MLADPFGGVGLGGIVAASKGLRWVGVELEERFVELGKQNFDLHRRTWEEFGDPLPVLVQGDSRRFAEIVGEVVGCITSPPFSAPGMQPSTQGQGVRSDYREGKRTASSPEQDYGTTPGQIGSLKAGTIDGVLQTDDVSAILPVDTCDTPEEQSSLGGTSADSPLASVQPPGLAMREGDKSCPPREAECRRHSDNESRTLKKASPDHTKQDRVMVDGKAVPITTEDMDGKSSDGKHSNEMETNVKPAGKRLGLLSTTSAQKKKPVENGITNSTTSSHCAEDAIPLDTSALPSGSSNATSAEQLRQTEASIPSNSDDAQNASDRVTSPMNGQGVLDCVITSPPYAESISGPHKETETAEQSQAKRNTAGGSLGQSQRHGGYGATEGNIGNLKEGTVDGAVTSPPYSDTRESGSDTSARDGLDRCGLRRGGTTRFEYGKSDGQIGNTSAQTYWQAMRQVYAQMHLALKPGGVCACVIKDYVKNKARVPLCDDTVKLLESIGFRVFERTRAWVVTETRTPGLFGDVVKTKSRKSFFRRLAEAKGSPPIDWEEVIWCQK